MKYCEDFVALLDPYVDEELTEEENARVRAHLAGCPACRSYVEGALAIRAAFPEVEETAVPEGFAAGVMCAVRDLENAEKPKTRPAERKTAYWKRILPPLAACFAIVLAMRYAPARGNGTGAANDSARIAVDTAAPSGEADAAEDTVTAYAASEAETEESGLETAPAARITAEEPATFVDSAPGEDGIEEPENAAALAAGTFGASASRTVRLTADQAGELLSELPCTVEGDGVRCYQLTGGEFDALLEALAERDILPPEEELSAAETVPEGYYLVYVTEE